ncbi:hypothetical protein SAMN04489761_1203 [Tenacibaculum sp. MAR_2009_124]|uniref:hypothetical protein n=1 Tax=Tenacibaculum sp. MAR_2009_124 TaxID=1250059 RepID=UPI00089B3130|nr:hypothetical protein [Tenacibaculum sp. MAR_2009_124]SEB52325.1 hypothetical protein SAMN04489761_1203 [Tenacibaculum sp. MAR_2009_124]
MKINFYISIIFLMSWSFCYGQYKYLLEYKASFTTSSVQPTWGNSILYIENGVEKVIYNVNSITNGVGVDIYYQFTTTNPISKIRAKTVSVSGTLTSCTSAASYSSEISFNGCYDNSSFIMDAVNANRCVRGGVEKFNLLKIENFKEINNFSFVNNELKQCEPRELNISTRCKYALEYKIPSNMEWEELIPYGSNPAKVTVSMNSFIGLSLGENVKIRLRYVPSKNANDSNAFSEILTYFTIGCSPILQEPVVTRKTTCSYTDDGSFTLNFDRELNSGELLAITLYQRNSISGLYDIIPSGGQILNISSLSNKSYTWPYPLTADSYKVKFQSHSGGLSGSDGSWSSLEFSNPFTIGESAPVDFSVIDSADESCFNVNDGYIEIQGSRESGRSLLYQYSTNGGANFTSWRTFLSGDKTKINSLGKGNYRIKVRDNKGCLAK